MSAEPWLTNYDATVVLEKSFAEFFANSVGKPSEAKEIEQQLGLPLQMSVAECEELVWQLFARATRAERLAMMRVDGICPCCHR